MPYEVFMLLYEEKNEYLKERFLEYLPYDFYRFIFPKGSFQNTEESNNKKGNGLALAIEDNGKARHITIYDNLEKLNEITKEKFVFTSPISYFGKRRTAQNARELYAMAFDLDGVEMKQLKILIDEFGDHAGGIPRPTFLVNSGTGFHLYYVFEEPIPLYPANQQYLRELKYALTPRIWFKATSTIETPQKQGIMQGFRIVGSPTKIGDNYPVTAFKTGEKINLEYLIRKVPEWEKIESELPKKLSKITLEEAKEKYPEWYEKRIIQGKKRDRWTNKRALYDWWLRTIKAETGTQHGHRYHGIFTLAIYAEKCEIEYEELRKDAYKLLPIFNKRGNGIEFTKDDIESALNAYNEKFVRFPRDEISRLSGIEIKANKRNYRNQETHLKLARGQLAILKELGEATPGRPTKEKLIKDYAKKHPNASKSEIARALNVSRSTVVKWL